MSYMQLYFKSGEDSKRENVSKAMWVIFLMCSSLQKWGTAGAESLCGHRSHYTHDLCLCFIREVKYTRRVLYVK